MNIASMIDHTLLGADVDKKSIENICNEAMEYGFKSVCVNPYYVSYCSNLLYGSKVKVATVVGFPLGNTSRQSKFHETAQAIEDGAEEIDMVINISALKNKEYEYVLEDIKSVIRAVDKRGLVKVIIETCLLTDEEKKIACKLAIDAGADFIKTSTGFNGEGAKIEDIKLIKSVVGDQAEIKASGGIRDYEKAKAMIDAGATRIGASAGIKIVEES